MKKTRVRVKFLSTMKQTTGQDDKVMVIDENATITDLLKLVSMAYSRDVVAVLFEDDKISIRNDMLVLVNDVEISVLEGDETRLSDGDEVALMPVAHGG